MDEIIRIKCPFDGVILQLNNQPGLENKNVTCPVCKHKYPFTQFKRVGAPASPDVEPPTEYPESDEHTSINQGGAAENFTLGRLMVQGTGMSYQLQPGRNLVGRKSVKSQADFQIDTAEGRAMSREHVLIEVKKVPGKGFVHYISLFKEKVNKTFINSEPLEYGDCVILAHGDIIKLPDANVEFELPDDEATDI